MKSFLRRPISIIFLIVFTDMLGYGILIPVIPSLFIDPTSPYYLLDGGLMDQGYILLGLLIALFPLGQFLSTSIAGELSDIFGRKRILLLSLIGTALCYALFGSALAVGSLWLIFFSRFLAGIAGGVISVAQAVIADITPEERRAERFGLIGAAVGLGFIVGPVIGGVLQSPVAVAWFGVIITLLNLLILIFFLPETRTHAEKFHSIDWLRSLRHLRDSFFHKRLRMLFLTNFLFQSGFTFFATFFSVLLIARYGLSEIGVGFFFAYIGISVALSQVVAIKPLSSRFSPERILPYALIGAAVILPLYTMPTAWQGLIILVPLYAVAYGLSQANLLALISKRAGSDTQGEVLGINASLQAFGQFIPPMISGFVVSRFSPSTPTLIAAAVTFAAWIIFVLFERKHRILER